MPTEIQEPKGIAFFNIKSGETNYAKSEAQIQGYLNSSDMGINASREQDFGWRLGKEWVEKIRTFRKDSTRMSLLLAKNSGRKPTIPQILYAIYGEELRNAREIAEENENPFEEEYLRSISSSNQPKKSITELEDDDEDDEEIKPKAFSALNSTELRELAGAEGIVLTPDADTNAKIRAEITAAREAKKTQ